MVKKYVKNVTVDLDVDNNRLPPTYNEDTITNWENFGNAIIVQAVNDYRRGLIKVKDYAINHAKRELPKGIDESDNKFKETYRKHELEYARESSCKNHDIILIEKFFNSDFFRSITDFKVDPLYILNGVREEMNIPSIP